MLLNKMENFRLLFSKHEETMSPELYKSIVKNFDQLENATNPFHGKSKETVRANKEQLVDAVFSMKEVSEKMLITILELANIFTSKSTMSENIVNVIENTFNKMSADLSNNLVKALLPTNNNKVIDEEKHVVYVESKDESIENFDSNAWTDVVKGKLAPSLKKVPIVKAALNKQGKGCLILPNKKAQEEVRSALENDFKVSVSSKPKKHLLPKLKIYNIDVDKYNDKSILRSALLEKNTQVSTLVEGGHVFDVILIDTKWNYAIIKVSPEIRNVINTRNRLFIDMESVRTRDHFQPLQCYACQKHGHKQGSPECSKKDNDTSTCLYCAGNHQSKSCEHKKDFDKHRCVNCLHSNVQSYRENCNHTSTSLACPFVIKEVNSLIMRTSGLDDAAAKKFLL